MGGMKWKSPSPANPEIELVRPFLGLPKKQIAGFAASQEMAFREDSSNEDTHVPRNFLRHAVLPVLARFPGGGGVANIPRAMDLIGAEADFVEGCARAWLAGERSKPFADLHPALRRKIAHLQLVEAGLAPSFDLVEALTQKLDEPVNIDPARAARIDSGGRLHLFPSGLPGFNPERHPTILDSPEGQVRLGEACLAWRFLGQVPEEFPPGAECFDAATIGDRIVVRHWQPGDRFQPIGMPSPVKLQNLFVNAGISRAERRELPVAEDTLGRIFWVRGLRMSELHKVTPRTARCLQFRFGPSQAPAP